MERRHLLKALAALAAAPILAKAIPVQDGLPVISRSEESEGERVIVLRVEASESRIVKVITDDIRRNGRVRDAIARVGEGA